MKKTLQVSIYKKFISQFLLLRVHLIEAKRWIWKTESILEEHQLEILQCFENETEDKKVFNKAESQITSIKKSSPYRR